MSQVTDRPRRWFTFSLRTLFVIVTILGASVGWLVVQFKWMRERNQPPPVILGETQCWIAGGELGEAPWSLRPFRATGYKKVFVQTLLRSTEQGRSEAMEHVKSLFPEADVSMEIHFGDCISPDDQAYLYQHPELKQYMPH